ncbi:unnamed protein product [Effrenium voratum]|uniref:Uncharacterized protein n=1 Tax=Effrenium voratum TaxID=2562239 RepID=A0AA36JF35_9DINO|nr:unnamed protein product [Effrenium voratum]
MLAAHCPCMLEASEMHCQELPCAQVQRAVQAPLRAFHQGLAGQLAELSQSPVKIAGQITLACWQNCECVARFSISCAGGVCLLARVVVACGLHVSKTCCKELS